MITKDLLRSKANRSQPSGTGAKRATVYATHSDFCGIFMEDMDGLYLLALLLTADHEKAEQCFVVGLKDCVEGNPVFKEWAHSWSRRTIIKNAIRMISPVPDQARSTPEITFNHPEGASEANASIAAVVRLEPFERFVFVMSVLEGRSNQECAILLNCTRQDVITLRTRALQHLALADVRLITPVAPSGLKNEQFLSLIGAA